ncbi:hypothetical protein ACVOMV_29425 [Mesorhizobium atlanticum]
MVYVRGHAHDFRSLGPNRVRPAGASPTCSPISSAWRIPTAARMAGEAKAAVRLHVQARHTQGTRSTVRSWKRARQAGFELTDDYNGSKQEGFGPDGAEPFSAAAAGRRRMPIWKPALKTQACEVWSKVFRPARGDRESTRDSVEIEANKRSRPLRRGVK